MIHESEARRHYLEIKAVAPPKKLPLGFTVPLPRVQELYQQPYGLPSTFIDYGD